MEKRREKKNLIIKERVIMVYLDNDFYKFIISLHERCDRNV